MDSIQKRLTMLVDTIYALLPNVHLVLATIPYSKINEVDQRVAQYNEGIPAIVQDKQDSGYGITLVDVYPVHNSLDMYDDFHPNDSGYKKIANLFYNAIDALLYVDPTNVPVIRSYELKIYPNYPNPFNPPTWISFELQKQSEIQISISDLSGRTVRKLYCGSKHAGFHQLKWDGCNQNGYVVPSGIYFVRFTNSEIIQTQKIMLV